MQSVSYKTLHKTKKEPSAQWVIIDAKDQIVGRLATRVAKMLMGKHRTYYAPNKLCGDRIIILNAEKIRFTGDKLKDKLYIRHTGYPGGQRQTTPLELLSRRPERVVEMAVKNMLPKTKLGSKQYGNLHVYAGEDHPHQAQSPITKILEEII